jgi:hypothetical protein
MNKADIIQYVQSRWHDLLNTKNSRSELVKCEEKTKSIIDVVVERGESEESKTEVEELTNDSQMFPSALFEAAIAAAPRNSNVDWRSIEMKAHAFCRDFIQRCCTDLESHINSITNSYLTSLLSQQLQILRNSLPSLLV